MKNSNILLVIVLLILVPLAIYQYSFQEYRVYGNIPVGKKLNELEKRIEVLEKGK